MLTKLKSKNVNNIIEMQETKKARVIALYLPQFHPIPENDEWYGKGFTEWTNVGRAKPLFKGHYQPRVPADLGYYDLRVPETREAQAQMAKEYGVEGFCYWHYWFGNGRRLLERPFDEVVSSGKPDFPFCLAWANHSWYKKTWEADKEDKLLIEQKYPGEDDDIKHFYHLLPAFKDPRYIRVNDKPLFVVYAPFDMPDTKRFVNTWNKLAKENGLKGFYFVAQGAMRDKAKILQMGFNAIYTIVLTLHEEKSFLIKAMKYIGKKWFHIPITYKYSEALEYYCKTLDDDISTIPSIIPNWDHSPRSKRNGLILTDATPENFYKYMKRILGFVKNKPQEERLVFLRSWNEWGEGNYMEPDLRYGKGHLESLKKALEEE